jgi:RHS repeat-associated protein
MSSSGSREWTYAYDPFGATRTATKVDPSAPENPMQFVGEYNDPNGLYNLRARQYDPTIGRMLGIDPASQTTATPSVSLFAYVDDRPTRLVDPSGETSRPATLGRTFAAFASSSSAPSLCIPCLLPWALEVPGVGEVVAVVAVGALAGYAVYECVKHCSVHASVSDKVVDDVLEGSAPERVGKQKVDIYRKDGGNIDSDYEELTGISSRGKPEDHAPLKGNGGWGSKYTESGDGRPTIRIDRPGHRPIKIRYPQET